MTDGSPDGGARFVPDDFAVPSSFTGPGFRLEPLGPQHNERDHEAWMTSIDHIRSTPGFPRGEWPYPMDLAENLGDLERHARDFADRTGFTYSILDVDEVIGCVYIYPSPEPGPRRRHRYVGPGIASRHGPRHPPDARRLVRRRMALRQPRLRDNERLTPIVGPAFEVAG